VENGVSIFFLGHADMVGHEMNILSPDFTVLLNGVIWYQYTLHGSVAPSVVVAVYHNPKGLPTLS